MKNKTKILFKKIIFAVHLSRKKLNFSLTKKNNTVLRLNELESQVSM